MAGSGEGRVCAWLECTREPGALASDPWADPWLVKFCAEHRDEYAKRYYADLDAARARASAIAAAERRVVLAAEDWSAKRAAAFGAHPGSVFKANVVKAEEALLAATVDLLALRAEPSAGREGTQP